MPVVYAILLTAPSCWCCFTLINTCCDHILSWCHIIFLILGISLYHKYLSFKENILGCFHKLINASMYSSAKELSMEPSLFCLVTEQPEQDIWFSLLSSNSPRWPGWSHQVCLAFGKHNNMELRTVYLGVPFVSNWQSHQWSSFWTLIQFCATSISL